MSIGIFCTVFCFLETQLYAFSQIKQMKDYQNIMQIFIKCFCSVFIIAILAFKSLLTSMWSIVLLMGLLPVVSAAPDYDAFSDITFRAFSEFVESHFSSKISLAAVLVVLFTMTSNTDLLNLHAQQQNPQSDELNQAVSGWIKGLARALEEKLGQNTDRLFQKSEHKSSLNNNQVQNTIAIKLDALSKLLKLYPYDAQGQRQTLKQVSEKAIKPALVICPNSIECQTVTCNGRALHMDTRDHDVP